MRNRDPWVVRLGPAEWGKFTRTQREGLQLLGSVQRGAGIGALAATPDGRYLQVNGDYVSELDANEVGIAVESAKSKAGIDPRLKAGARGRAGTTPVVVVRRRRIPAPA